MKSVGTPTNIVKFRLRDTPDGDLLVTLYYLNVFDQATVNGHIAGQVVEGRLHPNVLYEGNFQNMTCYQKAIYNLMDRVEQYVNCVRIERLTQ